MSAREMHHKRANRHWTPAEKKMLALLWGTMSVVPLSKKLGRSVDSIVNRARQMGLGSPSRGTKPLNQLCRESGYHPKQIRYALKNLGMALQYKFDTRHPKEPRIYRQYAISFEQEEAILAYLAKHPDGSPVYCNAPGYRTKQGQWGVGNKPPACLDCGRTDRPHRGRGFCSSCHMRDLRRKRAEARRAAGVIERA